MNIRSPYRAAEGPEISEPRFVLDRADKRGAAVPLMGPADRGTMVSLMGPADPGTATPLMLPRRKCLAETAGRTPSDRQVVRPERR
jgi:hypothetical protein